jgi:hypothetical protein
LNKFFQIGNQLSKAAKGQIFELGVEIEVAGKKEIMEIANKFACFFL